MSKTRLGLICAFLGTRQQLLVIYRHWSVSSLIAFLFQLFPHKRDREKENGSEGRRVEGRGREREKGAIVKTTATSQHLQTEWWICRVEKAHPWSKPKLTCLLHFCVCTTMCQLSIGQFCQITYFWLNSTGLGSLKKKEVSFICCPQCRKWEMTQQQ